jgi:hypothetical protein
MTQTQALPTRADAIARLTAAIAAYQGDTGPGSWSVEDDQRGPIAHVTLLYTVFGTDDEIAAAIDGRPERTASEWGGDAILEACGLSIYDGLADSGEGSWCDSAYIEVEEED